MSAIKNFLEQRLKNYKHINKKKALIDYSWILLGSFVMSVGYIVFISPLKLAPGGVYGIAIILHHLFDFPIGLAGISMDIPLLIIGTLWLGGRFGLKTLVGIISLSGFNTLMEHWYGYTPLITLPGTTLADPAATFISALCGAVLIGIGLGMIFRSRGTSGGTDIIAMIIAKYMKHVPIGHLIIIVDSTIVLGSLVAFKDWTIPLYSWMVIYVSGVVINKIIAGFSTCKAVLIISDKHEEIRDKILHKLHRGGTYINGEGMYNHTAKKIIFTSISPKQLPILMYMINSVDPKAFISVVDASETIGEGFTSLQDKL